MGNVIYPTQLFVVHAGQTLRQFTRILVFTAAAPVDGVFGISYAEPRGRVRAGDMTLEAV